MSKLLGLCAFYMLLFFEFTPVYIKATSSNFKIIEQPKIDKTFTKRVQTQLQQLQFGLEHLNSKIKLIKNAKRNVSADLTELENFINFLSTTNELIQADIRLLLAGVHYSRHMPPTDTTKQQSLELCGNINKNLKLLDQAQYLNGFRNYSSHARIASNCAEATIGNYLEDNMYILSIPLSELRPFCAYCIHENGIERAWTIIQRREDGSENFNRNWLDYKQGFGDVLGEYWIGLERMHAMTINQPHELWILLEDYDGERRFAKYSKFSISSEEDGYRLTVEGYLGNAGNSFGRHNNMKFSTFDVNNDLVKTHCARLYKGGWWYKNCYDCNLNGVFYSYANKDTEFGINWNDWLTYKTSLRYTHMAIRPL